MQPERVEKLKQQYTDEYVVVDAARPELARFAGLVGRVKTVNFNGRALVEFDGRNDCGWYDIELDYLRVTGPPESEQAPPAAAPENTVKLSPLELARMAKEAEKNQPESQEPPSDAATS